MIFYDHAPLYVLWPVSLLALTPLLFYCNFLQHFAWSYDMGVLDSKSVFFHFYLDSLNITNNKELLPSYLATDPEAAPIKWLQI